MNSIFTVVNNKVTVPILPYQLDKLQNLAPGLAKKQLPADQFCQKLGGYPLLIRVLSAEQDSFPLYGGVWGVNLNCSVVVCQPVAGNVIQGRCCDRRNGSFNYMNTVNISILKPQSADGDAWGSNLPQSGESASLVILGYGNAKPLADTAPKTNGRRMQIATTKPEPVLYARLESDPDDPDEYHIPYGLFKPVKTKSSTRLSESEVEAILSKLAVKPKEKKQEVHPEIKTEIEETPKKKKKSRNEKAEEETKNEVDISYLRVDKVKIEDVEHSAKKKKKKYISDVQNGDLVDDDVEHTPKKKKKSDVSDYGESAPEEVGYSGKKKKKKVNDFENDEMATDDVQHSGKKKRKKDEVFIKQEPVSPEREIVKKRKNTEELEGNPSKKKKRDLNNG